MDGNGRWAQEQGQDRLFGHFHGVESVRNIVEGCSDLGIQYLTLYTFSDPLLITSLTLLSVIMVSYSSLKRSFTFPIKGREKMAKCL